MTPKPKRGKLATGALVAIAKAKTAAKASSSARSSAERETCADCGANIGPGRAGRLCGTCRGIQ